MMSPRIAVDASTAPATPRTAGIVRRAERIPTETMTVATVRRRTRYRVATTGSSVRRAIRRSTICAATAATSTAAPAIAMRSQSIRVYSLGIERLPAGEALVDAVPKDDLVLA